jgi:hypothetical protein
MTNSTSRLLIATFAGLAAWLLIYVGVTSLVSLVTEGYIAIHIPEWGDLLALLLAGAGGALAAVRTDVARRALAAIALLLPLGYYAYEHRGDGRGVLMSLAVGVLGLCIGVIVARLRVRPAKQQVV